MYCLNCRKEIPDGIKFCPGCGAPQAAPELAPAAQEPSSRPAEPQQQTYAQPQTPAPSKVGKRVAIIFVVVALIAIPLLGVYTVKPSLLIGDPVDWLTKQAQQIDRYNDIINKGPTMLKMLRGMDAATFKTDAFSFVSTDGKNGSATFLNSPYIGGEIRYIDLGFEDSKINSVSFLIAGSISLNEFNAIRWYAANRNSGLTSTAEYAKNRPDVLLGTYQFEHLTIEYMYFTGEDIYSGLVITFS